MSITASTLTMSAKFRAGLSIQRGLNWTRVRGARPFEELMFECGCPRFSIKRLPHIYSHPPLKLRFGFPGRLSRCAIGRGASLFALNDSEQEIRLQHQAVRMGDESQLRPSLGEMSLQ